MLDFLIIGAQKSASTFLHRCIASHPDVFMPPQEIRFFEDPDYNNNVAEQIEKLVIKAEGRKVGIKRPDYLAREEVPKRIKSSSPHARLVVTLRNPIDRAVSAYYHQMKLGFLPVLPLNEGMRKVLDGQLSRSFPKSDEILEYGLYAKHLQRYQSLFPAEQLLVLLDQDLHSNSAISLKKVFEHIGVTVPLSVKQKKTISNQGVYALPRLSFINLRNRWVFDYRHKMTRIYRKPGILGHMVNSFVIGVDRLFLAKIYSNQKPSLDVSLRDRLTQFYSDDVANLEDLLKQDLSGWFK
jgi:hypothetical protein